MQHSWSWKCNCAAWDNPSVRFVIGCEACVLNRSKVAPGGRISVHSILAYLCCPCHGAM